MATITKGTISKSVVSKANISVSELLVLDDRTSVITSAGSVSVNENISTSTTAYTATARDSAGSTSGFSFAISTGDSNDFNINSSSGVVTFKASPDFETKTSYTFIVTATKSGQPTATKSVTIGINDVVEFSSHTVTNARRDPIGGVHYHGYWTFTGSPATGNAQTGHSSITNINSVFGTNQGSVYLKSAYMSYNNYGGFNSTTTDRHRFEFNLTGDHRNNQDIEKVVVKVTDENGVVHSEDYNFADSDSTTFFSSSGTTWRWNIGGPQTPAANTNWSRIQNMSDDYATLIQGQQYRIGHGAGLGSNRNWTAIGADGTPAVGEVFTVNDQLSNYVGTGNGGYADKFPHPTWIVEVH